MAITLEQRSLEMVEMGQVRGRHLILIVERNLVSIEGDRYGCWGDLSPRAIVVIDGNDSYVYSLQDVQLSLEELKQRVDGLAERLISLQDRVERSQVDHF